MTTTGYCRTLGHREKHPQMPTCVDWQKEPHTSLTDAEIIEKSVDRVLRCADQFIEDWMENEREAVAAREDYQHAYQLILAAPHMLAALNGALDALNQACNEEEIINQNPAIGTAILLIQFGIRKASGR